MLSFSSHASPYTTIMFKIMSPNSASKCRRQKGYSDHSHATSLDCAATTILSSKLAADKNSLHSSTKILIKPVPTVLNGTEKTTKQQQPLQTTQA